MQRYEPQIEVIRHSGLILRTFPDVTLPVIPLRYLLSKKRL
jgi:hypothetical protein